MAQSNGGLLALVFEAGTNRRPFTCSKRKRMYHDEESMPDDADELRGQERAARRARAARNRGEAPEPPESEDEESEFC